MFEKIPDYKTHFIYRKSDRQIIAEFYNAEDAYIVFAKCYNLKEYNILGIDVPFYLDQLGMTVDQVIEDWEMRNG